MLVYRSVTHFLCQKMQFWKKNMSSGMQSPTSSKLHQKKTLPAIFADGFDGLKHGKKWRRDWDEQFKPCSIFQGPFPPSHSIFVRDTCPPPKQTTPWTWNSVPSLENSWKMFVFRFQFHIKLQLCTFFTCFLKRYIDPKIEWWWN